MNLRIVGVVLAIGMSVLAASAQKPVIKEDQLQRIILFEGAISLAADGAVARVPLRVEEIFIDGGQRVPELRFPFKGLLIVQLRGGELRTFTGEAEQERQVSEFWIVPPGMDMELATEDDSAILRAYLIGEAYLRLVGDKPIVSRWQMREGQYEELSPNLFVRESHLVGNPEEPLIRVLDINIGPGKTADNVRLPGAAYLQIISGEAMLTINQQEQEGLLGTNFTIGDGELFTIDNRRGEKPVKLRALVFTTLTNPEP